MNNYKLTFTKNNKRKFKKFATSTEAKTYYNLKKKNPDYSNFVLYRVIKL